ncbi:SDR family NAD(P)-dependent oxidoreductase [Bythopirellula goksoeyrii]|uniref:Cyclopentanol dehydrogenase n=1 Tax=Bythopirellula goksoeyrii TaxID=1400387 RepID=A0A5B9QCW6_9BACT|nr:SDR family NAD(P)-dependent oxidoreductase [Bythopirellula goksoeyrii]QEG35332.1 Cyclopentanol dehydrogenase [Bythopirellula goksoeyrii]
MNESQNHRLALVTGGASGLGREFCLQLAAQGWHVIVADVDQAGSQETLAEIERAGGRGQIEHLDVTDQTAWNNLMLRLRAEWPRLDLLINNAGICSAGKIGESPLAAFRRVCEVNLFGVINGCHAMVPWMRETAPGGAIVNIASVAALLNAPAMAAYSASKAGVVSFSETLFGELRNLGISVTVVLPGFFASQLLRRGDFCDELFRRIAQDYTNVSTTSAAEVAKNTLRAVEKKQLHVPLGWRVRMVWLVKRLVPTLFQRMVAGKCASDELSHSEPEHLQSGQHIDPGAAKASVPPAET